MAAPALGMQEMALIVETLAACGGGSTVGQLFMINPIFGGVSIARFGSDAMKSELLPKIIAGEINCCMALTEPDAGSNSLEIKTFATRDGNGWRLNGRKIWITGVDAAQKMLVVARTTKSQEVKRRTDGLSMFIVDVERKGLDLHADREARHQHAFVLQRVLRGRAYRRRRTGRHARQGLA